MPIAAGGIPGEPGDRGFVLGAQPLGVRVGDAPGRVGADLQHEVAALRDHLGEHLDERRDVEVLLEHFAVCLEDDGKRRVAPGGLQQPRGALPVGPLLVMVHVASVWVPFTSESKEAVASYDEILKEMKLALQDCGRKLGRFIRRGQRERDAAKKRAYIEKYIPQVAIGLQEILGFPDREREKIVDDLTDVLERSRRL